MFNANIFPMEYSFIGALWKKEKTHTRPWQHIAPTLNHLLIKYCIQYKILLTHQVDPRPCSSISLGPSPQTLADPPFSLFQSAFRFSGIHFLPKSKQLKPLDHSDFYSRLFYLIWLSTPPTILDFLLFCYFEFYLCVVSIFCPDTILSIYPGLGTGTKLSWLVTPCGWSLCREVNPCKRGCQHH